MKIDEEGRKFFGSLETLERMDQLNEAAEAYVEDLAPKVLRKLSSAIRTAITKTGGHRWRAVDDRVSPHRFIGAATASNERFRVEFGYDRKNLYCELPSFPWVGIWAEEGLNFDAIIAATSHSFVDPILKQGKNYPIHELVANWPNLHNGTWAGLHALSADDGEAVSNVIAAQIVSIIQSLDAAPECVQPIRGRRPGRRTTVK